jgi:hypothetical protein
MMTRAASHTSSPPPPKNDVADMGFPAGWEQMDIWQEQTA